MSSAPSSTPPSSAEFENLGVIFVGFVATTVLYGLTFFQTYIYYSRYPRDSQWIRYLVTALCVLDTTASALVSEVLYYYLIVMFDVNMDVLYATTTFCIQYMLSVLLTFISSVFFAHRVFQVTGGSKPVTLVLICLSVIALVFGLTATAQMIAERRLSEFGSLHMQITAAMSQVTGLILDIIVFATISYSLRQSRFPDMVVPHGFLPTTIRVFVGRGLGFTIVQAAYFCVFMAAPSRQFWIPLQMVASKFYVNILLAYLNTRDVRLGQGLNEEDSFVDRKLTIGRLPASIRVNVTDVKATTQSVNFNTARQGVVESLRTGQESRKTYQTCQDEQGNEYTQVSTGSSQSQTDTEADKICISEQHN